MGNILGGFKNMLRRWRINLKLKKNKYWRIKSLGYSLIAIVYLPIGVLFSKRESKIENKILKTQPNIVNDIKTIDKEINKQIKENNAILDLDDRIKDVKQKISKLSEKENNYFNNKLEIIMDKKGYIEKRFREKIENKDEKINDKNFDILNYIKETNKAIDINIEKIDLINSKIIKATNYNILYFYENELKYIQNQVEILKKEYKKLKEGNDFFINCDFDKYKLLKDDKSINKLLTKIEEQFKIVDLKKKEIYNKKDEKKVDTKVKKEKKLDKQKQKINEIEMTNQIIIQNIIRQEKYFENFLDLFNKSENKITTLFDCLNSFLLTTLGFKITLFPFKSLNFLINSVIINNSIRTMRRMITPYIDLKYQFFDEKYYESKNLLLETYKICCDSLEQLCMLELDLKYLDEDNEIYIKLNSLKEMLENQIEQIKQKNKTIDKIYVKNKF